jgi:hypothetical protein
MIQNSMRHFLGVMNVVAAVLSSRGERKQAPGQPASATPVPRSAANTIDCIDGRGRGLRSLLDSNGGGPPGQPDPDR